MTDETLDVFNDSVVEEKPEIEPEQPEEKGEPESEEKVKEPESDKDAEPPAADETEAKSVPVAALKSERQKRQAAESELNELRRKLGKSEPEVEVSEDLFRDRTETTRALMVEFKPDYEAMEEIFISLADSDKTLKAKLRNSPNPAKFAYETAKAHVEYQRFQEDVKSDDWKAFQEFKASKAKPVVEDSPEVKRKKTALSLPNINKATSVASNSEQEPKGTLDELFS